MPLNKLNALKELNQCAISALGTTSDKIIGRGFVCYVPAHNTSVLRAEGKRNLPSEVLQGTITNVRVSGTNFFLELSSRFYAGFRIAWIERTEVGCPFCLRYDAGNSIYNSVEVGFYLI